MVDKKLAASLQKRTSKIAFPRETPAFYAFTAELNELLMNNSLGGDWEWDPEAGLYETTWVETHPIPWGRLTADRRATLDPMRPLAEEVERLKDEREAFLKNATDLFRSLGQ